MNLNHVCSKCKGIVQGEVVLKGGKHFIEVLPCRCTSRSALRIGGTVQDFIEKFNWTKSEFTFTFRKVSGEIRTITGRVMGWAKNKYSKEENLLVFDLEDESLKTIRSRNLHSVEFEGVKFELAGM
jgi:hypothetical protein